MKTEIINTGSELLTGDVLNSNSQFLCKELTNLGFEIVYCSTVGDDRFRLQNVVNIALKRSNIIFITGGLGPTFDDITKEVLSKIVKQPLVYNKNLLINLNKNFNINKNMTLNNLKQTLVFKNSTIFKNLNGTAPGLAIKYKNKKIFILPGPPNELIPMFFNQIKPFLIKQTTQTIKSRTIYLYGLSESTVSEKIKHFHNLKNPYIGICCSNGEIKIQILAKSNNSSHCNFLIDEVTKKIEQILKPFIYGINIKNMENALVQTAIKNGKSISVAESCTGGLIASKIVSISNASRIFKLSAVCYSNSMKEKILKISPDDLNKFGAVSFQIAQQMAFNVRKISNSDIGLATTGFAEKNSSQNNQIFVGISTEKKTKVFKLNFKNHITNSRIKTINSTALFAMNIARKEILNKT